MAKQGNKNGAEVEGVTFGEGGVPKRARWPFAELKKNGYFQVDDLDRHVALRTAASRAGKQLNIIFKVRKVRLEDGKTVIRVYRE